MSASSKSGQQTGRTEAPYCSCMEAASSFACLLWGLTQLSRTTNGFSSSCSSAMTRASQAAYSSLGKSVMLPSVVMTSPMVECSLMTRWVPTSAAILNGTASSNQGVCTILGASSSKYPSALGTMYPTQSIIRTRKRAFSPSVTVTASSGMNLGSVVIMVRPPADCGSSSTARSRLDSWSMLGMTSFSINCLMNVDFPVRTGPTTPI